MDKEPLPAVLPQVISEESSSVVQNSRKRRSYSESAAHSKSPGKRARRFSRGRRPSAIQAINLELRRAKQVGDMMTKRLQALQFDQTHMVTAARNAKTVPYTAACLDLKGESSPNENKKLTIPFTVGFWGYKPTFTPIKIFSLPMERFSNAKDLASLVLANTDVQNAIAEIGIDDSSLAIVGFEMAFPKGYRYVKDEIIDPVRKCFVPFQTVPSTECALIDTDCALREFFWQTKHYASDEEGNAPLAQVTLRVALGVLQPDGGTSIKMLDQKWRTEEEKQWEIEERRLYLGNQSFAYGAEKKATKDRMKEIADKAQKAVDDARASKELERASSDLNQLALNANVAPQDGMGID